jgi:Fe-S cluster biogenesis protein NfuA
VSICRESLEKRIAEINTLMRAHAGGIELLDVGDDGTVSLRFAGMCTGCELRPLTMAATIRPGLLDIEGVRCVSVTGARISAEAEQRLSETLGPDHNSGHLTGILNRYRVSLTQAKL